MRAWRKSFITSILTILVCKLKCTARDKNEKSRLRVIIDLHFASDQQISHAYWTFQLFCPCFVNDYSSTHSLKIHTV